MLRATPGETASIYINKRLVLQVDVVTPTTILDLPIHGGQNTILVKQAGDTYQTLLVAARYAVYLSALADETFESVERHLIEQFEQHFASFFSIRLTEHQLEFADLLPATLSYQTLLGKFAVRAITSESSTTRGVDDIVSAVTVSTPYVEETIATTDVNVPNPKWSDAQDFGGYRFHLWLPNTCVASWYGFVRLLDMVRGPDLQLVSATDARVSVNQGGAVQNYYFDTTASQCTNLDDPCEDDYHIWARIRSYMQVWVCPWSYPFDVEVTLPLGRSHFDGGEALDSGTLLDSLQETAPPDGWVGTNLSNRFDSGECLDTMPGTAASEAEALCCPQPIAVVLAETLDTMTVDVPFFMSASITVLPG